MEPHGDTLVAVEHTDLRAGKTGEAGIIQTEKLKEGVLRKCFSDL